MAAQSIFLTVCTLLWVAFPGAEGFQNRHKDGPVTSLTAWLDSVTPEPKPVEVSPAISLKSVVPSGGSAGLEADIAATNATNATNSTGVEEEPQTAASVFHNLKDSADELKKQIEDAEKAHVKQIKDHEDYLKGMLEDKRANSSKLEDQNQDYRDEIQKIRSNTDKLFMRAKQLKLESKVWKDNWRELEQNLTLVMQVTQKTLQSTDDVIASPDLDILQEMNNRAQMEAVEEYQNDILKKVGGPVVLLGKNDPETSGGSDSAAPAMVRVLDKELAEMAVATSIELRRLDDSYALIFKEENSREVLILKDQARLQEIRESLLELRVKLEAAVKHLEQLKEGNEKKGLLIRAFAQEVGLQPMPTNGTTRESWDSLNAEEAAQKARLDKRFGYPERQPLAEEDASANETTNETANDTMNQTQVLQEPIEEVDIEAEVSRQANSSNESDANSTKFLIEADEEEGQQQEQEDEIAVIWHMAGENLVEANANATSKA